MSDDPIHRLNAALGGRYRIECELGAGGMGIVYLAEQSEPVQRTVALKVLKAWTDAQQALARFEVERQALAVMDHPSIAKVFDAGVTDDGRPYVVMERVEGIPIGEYCDDQRLTIRDRVTLLVKACHAIQHAHTKGVIHLDLKPSHILVSEFDGQPHPRIIDFGIAKAVEPEPPTGRVAKPREEFVGTPAYMSPEQIEGFGDIDTRSDVYSLGVVLYELLIGTLPYRADASMGWAAVAAHLVEDPPTLTERLSALPDTQETVASFRRTTPPALRRALRGDLDWVVARAMQRDRTHRYETAHALALDLERYLSIEPVLARPATAAYRTGKFVRRHRAAVSFASFVAMGLVAFGVTAAVQAERTARARDDAEARRAQAEGLIDFMLTDLRDKLEPMGRLDVLDDVGTRALEYFAELPAEAYTEDELSTRSLALYQIGQVRLEQGRLPEAGAALEQSLRLARELSRRAPEDVERIYGLAQAEFWAGERLRRQGDAASALSHFQAYRDLSVDLARRVPESREYQLEVGYSHTNIGAILRAQGDLEGALAEFRAAQDVREALAAAEPESQSRRYDVAQGHDAIGIILRDLGRLEEAQAHFEQDVELKSALVQESPDNRRFAFRLAVAHQFLGRTLHYRGDVDGAERQYRASRDVLLPLAEGDPTNLRWSRNLAAALVWHARQLRDQGALGAALDGARDALLRMRELATSNPDQRSWQADLAGMYRENARILLSLGRPAEAQSHADEAVAIATALAEESGDQPAYVADLAGGALVAGDVLARMGRSDEARARYATVVELMQPLQEESTDGEALTTLAFALAHTGRADEADAVLARLQHMGFAMPEMDRIRTLVQTGTPRG